MLKTVKSITAIGTRGLVKGKLFTAKKNSHGRFVLNRKSSSVSKGNTTNQAVNKVFTDSLCKAAELLETDEYLINLISEEGSRALREFKKVIIERV